MSGLESRDNQEIFRDSLSVSLVRATLSKELVESKETRLMAAKNGGEVDASEAAAELAEFIDVSFFFSLFKFHSFPNQVLCAWNRTVFFLGICSKRPPLESGHACSWRLTNVSCAVPCIRALALPSHHCLHGFVRQEN